MRVKGMPYDSELGENRFLVHDIVGMSYPELPRFFIDRENTNLAHDDDLKGHEECQKPPAWGGAYGYPKKGNEEVRNSLNPPGQNAGKVLHEPPIIEILGEAPRVRKAIRKYKVTDGRGERKPQGIENESLSTSKPFASDSSIASALEQHQPNKLENSDRSVPRTEKYAKDVIGLLEKALESLKVNGILKDFKFIGTNGGTYQLSNELQVLECPRDFNDSWTYHGKNSNDRRVVAVVKIRLVGGQEIFVCEIQPRTNRNGNSDGNLKGCVFLGPPSGFGRRSLNALMRTLIEHKGVWRKISSEITGLRYPYRHVGNPNEAMMMRTLKSAIKKLQTL